jgi:hypothetical protein
MSRLSVTGWPASCLTLPIGRYIEAAEHNPGINIPVSADAQTIRNTTWGNQ